MASVRFDSVSKVYDNEVRALRDFSLEIQDGEFMVLVGPSGCGKTTALRSVAGLEEISGGEIRIGNQVVNDVDPRHRDVAMVFQNYALYPYMSVYDNIAFSLKVRRAPKQEIEQRVQQIARILGLEDLLQRKPRQLSGGQRQRVAMGRAIVRDPAVFLMDEPLSNLDARLRVQMRAEVARIQHELGATTIYVTHDQVEAMTMGDRVTVLRGGVLQQSGEPNELYNRPANLFVASFIGSPPMNLFEASLERPNGSLVAHVGNHTLTVPEAVIAARPLLAAYAGKTVALGIRPEHVNEVGEARQEGGSSISGRVTATESLGSEVLVHVEIAAEPVVTEEVREVAGDVDPAVLEGLEDEARRRRATLVGRLDAEHTARPGDNVTVTVDASKLHFFDLDTGLAIYRD